MEEYLIEISEDSAGRRMDLFLAGFFKSRKEGLSRARLQRMISENKVALNGAPAKAHQKLKSGDRLKVQAEDQKERELKPEKIALDVVYEDDDLAVINKPCGLVVHPAPGNYEHTLVHALLYRFKNLSDVNTGRPGIVHRLDKETSGLLVVARNNFAHLNLAEQFARHTIKRKYIAVVQGKVEFDQNIIEAPIGRHPVKRKNMSVSFNDKAKFAKTYYRTLKRGEDFSLMELVPWTGRTHQLRVHMAFLGHPILGDTKYGKNNTAPSGFSCGAKSRPSALALCRPGQKRRDKFSRLALHAQYIGFTHPRTGEFMEFSSPIPKEFRIVGRQREEKA